MTDYRHQKRIKLMQDLFACTFLDENLKDCAQKDPESTLVKIISQLSDIDAVIQSAAPERPLTQINKVDLSILRIIVYESLHKKTPKKVLVNEAVELAKAFGSDNSARFINGALATILFSEST